MKATMETGRVGPEFTPKVIRILILATCIASIFCPLIDVILVNIFALKGFSFFLTLSWQGFSHLYLWQPVSYLFIYGAGENITLSWLLGLTMYMYLLWTMGSYIVERVGEKNFLALYFTSGIGAGLLAVLLVPLFHQSMIFAGPASAILALLVAWTMFNPESTILLFFVIPIRTKWLVVFVLGGICLIHLAALSIVPLVFYLLGPCISYLYCVAAWGLMTPFPVTHAFDNKVAGLAEKISCAVSLKVVSTGKIFDIRTGKAVDEEERFMDEMLEKIFKQGKNSLSWRERRKMEEIRKRRNRERPS